MRKKGRLWSGLWGRGTVLMIFLAFIFVSAVPAQAVLLKVGLLSEPKTLNPFLASDSWARKVLRHINQPLFIYEPKDLNLVPWLVTDYPVYSQDMKTATVSLKAAKWSDGTPFTTEDVVFTAQIIEEFKIPRHITRWSMVESVEAVDARTLKYHLKEQDSSFESTTLLSLIVQKRYWAPIVAKARESQDPLNFLTSYQGYDAPTLGPFYLKNWTQGNNILLLRNPHFFAKGKKMEGFVIGPYINGILFKFYGNADAGILALKKGDIDAISWSLSPGYVEDLEKDPNIEIFYNDKSGFNYLGFNCRKPPLDSKELRTAITYLIDKDFLVQRVLQGKGQRREGVIAPNNKFWYNPDLPKIGQGMSPQERTKKAYQILKDAGWSWEVPPIDASGNVQDGKGLTMPDGKAAPQLELLTPPADYDPNRAISAMLITEWLQKFGLPVAARPMAFNALLQKVKNERDYDMFMMGYGFIQPDPDVLRTFFHSKGDVKNGRNMVGYRNEAYDKLADESSTTMDREARRKQIFELQKMLGEDAPMVPLFAPAVIEAVRKGDFTGWVSTQDGIDNLWSYLTIKPLKNKK